VKCSLVVAPKRMTDDQIIRRVCPPLHYGVGDALTTQQPGHS
jgi:hypothetical protein